MNFDSDVVIGLEIHIQLDTKTKLFCSCPTKGSEEPNTRTCEVCLGMPGSKPVMNKEVLEYAMRLCLACGCDVAPELIFSRKSYFYPDNAKNYQITQYELPLGSKGVVRLSNGKEIRLIRIHVEEDPASLTHPSGMQNSKFVLADYNRSGNPLCELVTEPDMTSAEEARDFMKQLISILRYLKIFDISNGIVKADVNVSVKETGYIRSEIKNVTGFKEIENAIKYEVERQKSNPSEVCMETRGWDSDNGITFSLRKKESEEEYGYIIDPDLVPIEIEESYVKMVKDELPELAHEKSLRFIDEHGIKEEDAKIIAQGKELAELFDRAVKDGIPPKLAVSWVRHELNRVLNYNKKTLEEIEWDEEQMLTLLRLIEDKSITERVAQKILEKLIEKPFDVKEYVEKEGLSSVSDGNELEAICKEAIEEGAQAVKDYKSGNEKAINSVVGLVMRKTRGTARPDVVLSKIKELVD
ncbi:Asp-tRNA(Asn)/Glu-tRNA(Gln) amidotransferase subunit GatB [Candidatus Woesearchaeota archaeon]|nr:Asp-tRNA(Asn)/Glu-tRNA(Gln) amidotransferase subunit GatB [Candidatus Woesearchaeota archaeon]